ncbi:acetoin utilization AcuB family protein [Paenisporosarcina cavernae]|uniref:CBS domain-containing protein n=1 Tax=Paenisporosarcina cavernae TaxID=2320858 RepID=A0A385YST4_9BACL|nr:acetoin utilization AcuB family protein [Paenisporosarcina cavernae]AYC29869.1 CBS domain-containing protein [Paenisporosarcina cavernae]
MIVEEMMRRNVKTLSPDHTISDAIQLLRSNKIRHLPITIENKVVGIVTDRDIKEASANRSEQEELRSIRLESIMTKNPIIGHPLDFVEEVAVTFFDQHIGCLPIVQNGELVGIVTETDVLYKYIELTGANKPGSHLEVRVPDRPGVLYEVTKVFYEHQVNVWSVLVYPDPKQDNTKILVFRLKTMNPLTIIQDLRKEGFDVLWPNMPGMSE